MRVHKETIAKVGSDDLCAEIRYEQQSIPIGLLQLSLKGPRRPRRLNREH